MCVGIKHTVFTIGKIFYAYKKSLLLTKAAFIWSKIQQYYEILLQFQIAVFYVNIC